MSATRDHTEVERSRAANSRLVTVYCIDPDNARVRVIIDGEISAPLPFLVGAAGKDREWWCPSEGEQVTMLSPDGLPESAVVVRGVFCDKYPAPRNNPGVHTTVYRDGTVVEQNSDNSMYAIQSPGTIYLAAPSIVLSGTVTGGCKDCHIPYSPIFSDPPMPGGEKVCDDISGAPI